MHGREREAGMRRKVEAQISQKLVMVIFGKSDRVPVYSARKPKPCLHTKHQLMGDCLNAHVSNIRVL